MSDPITENDLELAKAAVGEHAGWQPSVCRRVARQRVNTARAAVKKPPAKKKRVTKRKSTPRYVPYVRKSDKELRESANARLLEIIPILREYPTPPASASSQDTLELFKSWDVQAAENRAESERGFAILDDALGIAIDKKIEKLRSPMPVMSQKTFLERINTPNKHGDGSDSDSGDDSDSIDSSDSITLGSTDTIDSSDDDDSVSLGFTTGNYVAEDELDEE